MKKAMEKGDNREREREVKGSFFYMSEERNFLMIIICFLIYQKLNTMKMSSLQHLILNICLCFMCIQVFHDLGFLY